MQFPQSTTMSITNNDPYGLYSLEDHRQVETLHTSLEGENGSHCTPSLHSSAPSSMDQPTRLSHRLACVDEEATTTLGGEGDFDFSVSVDFGDGNSAGGKDESKKDFGKRFTEAMKWRCDRHHPTEDICTGIWTQKDEERLFE